MLVAGCAAAPTATPYPTYTPLPTYTAVPSPTPLPATATPVPPSPTAVRAAATPTRAAAAPAPTAAPAAASLPPVTAWKAYRNEKYGFSLEYPKDWLEPTGQVGQGGLVFQVMAPSENLVQVVVAVETASEMGLKEVTADQYLALAKTGLPRIIQGYKEVGSERVTTAKGLEGHFLVYTAMEQLVKAKRLIYVDKKQTAISVTCIAPPDKFNAAEAICKRSWDTFTVAGQAPAGIVWETYDDQRFGFSIDFPKSWESGPDPTNQAMVFVASDRTQENTQIAVMIEDTKTFGVGPMDLDQYLDALKKGLAKQIQGYEEVSTEKVANDRGVPGYLLTFKSRGGAVQSTRLIVMRGQGIVYNVTCLTPGAKAKELAPICEEAINSFVLPD